MRSLRAASTRRAPARILRVQHTRRFVPRLEALESRWCPSASAITQTGHALTIQGDGANDTITISDNGQGGITARLVSTKGSQSQSFTGITAITVNAGTGNDTIKSSLTAALSDQETMTVNLGKGSSQVGLDYSAGLSNATLAVNLNGAAGASQLTTQFGAITDSRLNLMECLATGAKSHVNFGGTLSGSDATVSIDGAANDQVFAQLGNASGATTVTNSNIQFDTVFGKGTNSFALEQTSSLSNGVDHFDIGAGSGSTAIGFNVAGPNGVTVDPTSRLNLEVDAGTGSETTNTVYSGQMNGELDTNQQGGSAANKMSTVLTFLQGSTGRLHGEMDGNAGHGSMNFDVYDDSNPGGHSTLDLLHAVLEGDSGNYTLTATPNVTVIQ